MADFRREGAIRFDAMPIAPPETTIDAVLPSFLAEQRVRLSPKTFRKYEEVVELLRHCLEGYGYQRLGDEERRRWEAEFGAHEEGAFCRLFGPEKIPGNLDEFLDYFMVRKVIAGQELLKASGTVTGKLVRWLAERGYIDEESAADASGRAREAARDLPIADRLGMLLHEVTDRAPAIDPDSVGDEDWVEDYLEISDVEPGKIWFEGGVGPIAVPREVSDLARPPGLVGVRDRCQDRWELAFARGRRRLSVSGDWPDRPRRAAESAGQAQRSTRPGGP